MDIAAFYKTPSIAFSNKHFIAACRVQFGKIVSKVAALWSKNIAENAERMSKEIELQRRDDVKFKARKADIVKAVELTHWVKKDTAKLALSKLHLL
jgi:hypothetical protein